MIDKIFLKHTILKRGSIFYPLLFIVLTLISINSKLTAQSNSDTTYRYIDPNLIIVSVESRRASVYDHMNMIMKKTGLNIIYDSQLIDNKKVVRLHKGEYTIANLINKITQLQNLEIKIEDNYLVIFQSTTNLPEDRSEKTNDFFTISGSVIDKETQEPLPFVSIVIEPYRLGTVSNREGNFLVKIPDSLENSAIKFSHLGYKNYVISSKILLNHKITIELEPISISLQEVVVRAQDPMITINNMINNKAINYNSLPIQITAYFREGIEHKSNLTINEAILQIYKTPVTDRALTDQVKVLKKRQLSSFSQSDTLVAKIKSSIHSSLLLDIIKYLPDFITTGENSFYNFYHSDIVIIDNRRTYVVSFKQKEFIKEPLYMGKLFIDAETFALKEAHFGINPDYVQRTKNDIIIKRSRQFDITPKSVNYRVSYTNINGIYYISHVRGDLNFKVRRRKRIFSTPLHVWFEFVTGKIETENITPIPRNQRLSTRDIFSNTTFEFDPLFWNDFNTIIPEKSIKEFISSYNFNR